MAENAARLLLAALVGIFVARYLGPDNLGLLGFATSIFAVLIPFAFLGMRPVLVREFSVASDWRPLLVSSLSRQLPSAIIIAFIAAIVLMVARDFERDAVLMAMALFPLPVLLLGDTLRALFESQHNVRRIVVTGIVAALISSALKLVAIGLEFPLWVFALAVSVEAGVVAIGLLWGRIGKGTVSSVRYHYSDSAAKRLMVESWPLLAAAVAVTLYMRVDVVMLGLLSGDFETGIYISSARLSEFWYFLPVAAAAAVRPALSRIYAKGDTDQYNALTQRFITSSFAIAVLAALLTLLVARQAITFVYGQAFSDASTVLQIHVLAAPFVFIGVASSQWFIDNGMSSALAIRTTAGAAVNIAINFLLIPEFGASGAAVSTLISYSLAGMLMNGLYRNSRALFMMQLRAFRLTWTRR